MPAVRRANEKDAESIHFLFEGALNELSNRRGGQALAKETIAGYTCAELVDIALAQGAPKSIAAAWLASWHDLDVGFVLAAMQTPDMQQSPAFPEVGYERIGVIGCAWVDPQARELGAGGLLLEAASQWLFDNGASAVDSLVLPGDRQTKNLFERAGYKARMLVMRSSSPRAAEASHNTDSA